MNRQLIDCKNGLLKQFNSSIGIFQFSTSTTASLQNLTLSHLPSSSSPFKPNLFEQITQDFNQKIKQKEQKQIDNLLQKNFKLIEQSSKRQHSQQETVINESIHKTFGKVVSPTASTLFLDLPTQFEQPENPKSCIVSVLGLPNAGKSTILNHLMGKKISAVSSKSQTTRSQVMAVKTVGNLQIVFVDTPGIPKPSEQRIVPKGLDEAIWGSCSSADLIIYVVEMAKRSVELDLQKLKRICDDYSQPTIALVLNKIDKTNEDCIKKFQQKFMDAFPSRISRVFHTVGMSGPTLKPLLDFIVSSGIPRAWEYPPINDALLSKNEKAIEIIRDKIFKRCNQEIPYCTKLSIESWNETSHQIAIICKAYVSRNGHKIILIGKNGESLLYIRSKSIEEMEKEFSKSVKLFFEIKVES